MSLKDMTPAERVQLVLKNATPAELGLAAELCTVDRLEGETTSFLTGETHVPFHQRPDVERARLLLIARGIIFLGGRLQGGM